MNFLEDIIDDSFNTFLKKIAVLQKARDDFYVKIAKKLKEKISKEKRNVENSGYDQYEMKNFKAKIDRYNYIVGFLISSMNHSSNWIIPLIEDCYKKLGIDIEKRKILVIHKIDNINDNSLGFRVASNFLEGLDNDEAVDIFIVPSEAQFNLSSLAILGHEVGHVFWKYKEEEIINRLRSNKESLFIDEIEEAHIQELFCDEAGRVLFDIVFDIALIKTMSFSQGNKTIASETHPAVNFRIKNSIDNLDKKHENIEDIKKELEEFIKYFNRDMNYDTSDSIEDTVQDLSDLFFEKNSLDLNKIWKNISKGLNSFKPPIETVDQNFPTLFSPIEIVIGVVLYHHSKKYIQKNNEFIKYSSKSINEYINILKQHLIYAIGIYKFTKKAHELYKKDFVKEDLKPTLWSFREKKFTNTFKGSFSIVPTIYPKVQYAQNSVDIRLGSYFLVHRPSLYTHISPYPDSIDISKFYEEIYVEPGGEFVLHPHQFVLASTLEYISLPINYYGLILGRSSWGRLGLTIATATTVQAGFKGCITLELKNIGESPIVIKVGNRIAQLCLIRVPMDEFGEEDYLSNIHAKYIGPIKAEIPKIQEDIDWELFK